MTELTGFYREKVADFLKTVVCFDDHAYDDRLDNCGAVKAAAMAPDGFSTDEGETDTHGDASEVVGCVSDKSSSGFEAKDITDAFAEMDILCSVIKPHTDGKLARPQIEKLARTADVAIVDWVLKNNQGCNDTSIAREAIVNIVKHDEERGGCLRLIVIYSDEKGEQVIGELAELLSENGFKHVPGTLELQNAHTLIVFLQKAGASAVGVEYKDLPGRVVDSFTRLTSGLLPAAALSAISVIRQHSHHLLATFPATLDGAFLAHRCLIPDPNDAEQFLLDLFEGEIGALLAHSQVRKAVDGHRCTAWVESRFSLEQRDNLVPLLTQYDENKAKSFVEQIKMLCGKKMQGKELADALFAFFYSGTESRIATEAQEDFSILSTLDAHRRRLATLEQKPPRLHLGSVVRETDSGKFLLCVQPLCDSTRIGLEEGTIFPFLLLSSPLEQKNLDLCIPDEDEQAQVVWLSISPKPQSLVSYRFCGKSATEAYVEAAKDTKNGEYYAFRTSDGKCLEWMADLKIGKAQRVVSQLAARIHTLGIDEFEWLRLQGPRTS